MKGETDRLNKLGIDDLTMETIRAEVAAIKKETDDPYKSHMKNCADDDGSTSRFQFDHEETSCNV